MNLGIRCISKACQQHGLHETWYAASHDASKGPRPLQDSVVAGVIAARAEGGAGCWGGTVSAVRALR